MDSVAVGIDPTSGHEPFTLAALDKDLRLETLRGAEFDDVLDFLGAQRQVVVGLNAPSHVSTNIVRRRLEQRGGTAHALRGAGIREAEFELHSLGMAVSGTPHA